MEGGMHLAAAIRRRCLDQQLRQARPSPALQPLLPQLSSSGCQAERLQAHLSGRRHLLRRACAVQSPSCKQTITHVW